MTFNEYVVVGEKGYGRIVGGNLQYSTISNQ
jgi:hypothetical protein